MLGSLCHAVCRVTLCSVQELVHAYFSLPPIFFDIFGHKLKAVKYYTLRISLIRLSLSFSESIVTCTSVGALLLAFVLNSQEIFLLPSLLHLKHVNSFSDGDVFRRQTISFGDYWEKVL